MKKPCVHERAAAALAGQLIMHLLLDKEYGISTAAHMLWKYTEDSDPLFEYEAVVGVALARALEGRREREEVLAYMARNRGAWAHEFGGGSLAAEHGEQSISVSPSVH
jgi:hypothetical protein